MKFLFNTESLGDVMISGLRNIADKVSEMSSTNSAHATMTFVPQTESKFSSYRPVHVTGGQYIDIGSKNIALEATTIRNTAPSKSFPSLCYMQFVL